MDNRNTRRGGFYWIGNKPYLSVTEILGVIDKPALRYWFGQEVYYAMLLDPSIKESEALSAPYRASEKAKSRGSTIHSIIEVYKTTGEIEVGDDFQPYAQAFYDFMNLVKPEIISQEKSVLSEKYRMAGTMDLYAKIGDKYMIIDVKTGKNIYMESGLQLSAYAQMMRDGGNQVDEIAVLLLETGKDKKGTGKYQFQTMPDDIDAFLSCKKLYEYVNREKLLKAKYL